MKNNLKESPLYHIVNAKSVAFYGASNRPETMGSIILGSILSENYQGTVYPVHPREKEVKGLTAYANAAELPEIPDLVIMILPTVVVNQSLEDCGKKGIKRAIIVSGGFKEAGGEGIALEKQLLETARKYGIRLIGPNCLGVANLHSRLNSTPMMLEGEPGYIGLASQSGSFVTQMFNYLSRLGLGFSSAISVGNEADLDLVDCIEYFAACPHTKVIAIYIEGIKRGAEFIAAARKISPQKPIVALYVGGSEAGKKAAFSHTGSLSGPDQLYEGAFRQAGVVRAHSLTELFDYCWALATLPKPNGRNVVIQTHSGGPGASAADACSRNGMKLPGLSSATREALKPFLPHTASTANPVDLTFSQNQAHYFFDIPRTLMQDDTLDYLLIYLLMPENMMKVRMIDAGLSEEDAQKMVDGLIKKGVKTFAELKSVVGKPIVGFTYRSVQEKMVRQLIALGIPVFQDPERAAKAMKVVSDYYEMKARRNCN